MPLFKFIDSHAHLTSASLAQTASDMVQRAKEMGIAAIVNICTDEDSLQKGIILKKERPAVYLAAATTPHDVEQEGEDFFPIVKKAAEDKLLVAIGETGLDYHYQHSPILLQKKFLTKYFELALETALPLIFHCRDAFADLFAMADTDYRSKPGLLHCFTGTLEEARQVLDRGWYISFSGIVTFKKSEQLRAVARYVPLDRMMLETDSPYLAPQSKRGKVNEPAYLIETAEKIADLKGVSLEILAQATTENCYQFFSFQKPVI
jgi:TatD DNase family protein